MTTIDDNDVPTGELSFEELPFDKVMSLYELRMRTEVLAKSKNRTSRRLALLRRTKMLREYPELFDDEIMAEVAQTYERALKVISRQGK